MDTIEKREKYRQIIRDVLTPYVALQYSNGDITNEALFDRDNDRYTVISVGWQGDHRVHHSLIHIDIINGKVWIQRDGTEDGIGYALEAAGIPKEDIVPAFHPKDVRAHTGYAIA